MWEALLPRLDEILGLQDRQRKLPESAWFGEDQIVKAFFQERYGARESALQGEDKEIASALRGAD